MRQVNIAAAMLFVCALWWPATATPQPPPDAAPSAAPQAVIPPGQDDLIADMVGRGESLPGDCRLTAGQVDRTLIRATYVCAGSEVVFELRHPSAAPAGTTTTSRFAVLVASGSPPPGLTDALVARIRSREAAFEWKWLGGRSTFSVWTLLLLAAIGLALAVLIAVGRGRAMARRAHPG